MIVDELLRRMHEGRVKYVNKEEDPRDYRVCFSKIGNEPGFQISKTVLEGNDDIFTCLRLGFIKNPDD